MKERLKAPELRFPGFTDNWEERKLIDVKDNEDRYSYTGGPFGSDLKSSDYTEIGVRIIQLQNIGDGKFVNDYKIYTSEEKARSLNSNLIYPGEIIIAKMADPLARATILPKIEPKYLMASDGIRLKINTDYFDNYYILTLINSDVFRKEALNNSTGTTRKRIGLVTLGNLPMMIPSFEEQKKIGSFFKQLDDIIALHQRKLDLLKEQKKGYLQKMFPKNGEKVPELRFEGFTDDWELRKLDKIIDVHSGRDYKHLNKGNIPVYGTGGYMLSVNEALSEKTDAIGIGRKGTIDKPYLLKAPFWTVDTLFYATPQTNIDLQFTLAIFKKINWKKYDESTGVPSLSKSVINNVFAFLPSFKEQKKIGSFFQQLDDTITLHQRKLDLLKEQKKGYLQKMFI
ncbi:restriction endonuclease subunit S [Lactococcus lactis subsp. lactis]|uniref:restriction endonuclease subunit S n=1 Tax=Lactococcus lactis TaxID=1358 RepID=UPI0021A672A9|nr:restriction endonuclease subunit S [Lactococcus lactis]MCT0078688.1 restriction endonuclease subunit S [Lactococcus lactis subsp. lactis]